MPKISIVTPCSAVHYVRSQEGLANAELAFFEILISEIAANTGGQAAMVEDRLGRMSQLGFETIKLSSGVYCTAYSGKQCRGFTKDSTHIAASIGGQAAMVEDRLGHMSQLGFNTVQKILDTTPSSCIEFAASIGGQAARWRTGRVNTRSDFSS